MSFKYQNLSWLDAIKAIAMIWIFLNHIVERVFGFPYIANPHAGWPDLAERLTQLLPLNGYGVWDLPINIMRYIGWSGDQGVQLFIILSGFGLTWGALTRGGWTSFSIWNFYRRRASRIFPLWWSIHLFFAAVWLFTGWGLSLANPATYLSFFGIRFTTNLFYYFAPAWWYIGLLLQLYLIFPLLWEGLRRLNPQRFFLISLLVSFSARAVGLIFLEEYMDAWQRGAVFLTRLSEFSFGISLAAWMWEKPQKTHSRLRNQWTLTLALFIYSLGTVLSLTLLGMTIAPFLLGVGIFAIFYTLFSGERIKFKSNKGILAWIGQHTYALYLVHHPAILLIIPDRMELGLPLLFRLVAVVLLTFIGALSLEWSTKKSQSLVSHWYRKLGYRRLCLRAIGSCLGVALFLVCVEGFVRWKIPQEVLGWGERSSLESHPDFGWRLIPSQEFRLRWETYDYQVTSNRLGFPGPAYSESKGINTLRILTIGDAFTSAEGVHTELSWPRVLENELQQRLPENNVEVLNFAITGYGPHQYSAVVETFTPVYKPDWILIGFFVNEFQDVHWSNDEFRDSIGFHLPKQDGFYSFITLQHLRRILRLRVVEPFSELVRDQPRQNGYFLGNFSSLERDNLEHLQNGQELTWEQMEIIAQTAGQVGANVEILMIPAPVQICDPKDLAYYPNNIDLGDSHRFDLDQPQRLLMEMAETYEIPYHDLRKVLQIDETGCPYQKNNMHWTEEGHRTVAAYMADQIMSELSSINQ